MDDFTKEEIRDVLRKNTPISGSLADTIITTLIDNADDVACAKALEVEGREWNVLVSQFEEQIRHRVRDMR